MADQGLARPPASFPPCRQLGQREDELARTRLRIDELRQHSLELSQRREELARWERPGGSSLGPAGQAAERAEQARVHAAAARVRALAAYLSAADAHEAAADRHEKLASGGFGDAEEHRRRAGEHHQMSAVDRAAGAGNLLEEV